MKHRAALLMLTVISPVLMLPAGCGGPSEPTNPGSSVDQMVLIPAGEFLMGSEKAGNETERPVHPVYLDAFYIDQYEVSNQAFTDFLNQRGNRKEAGARWIDLDGKRCPIVERDGRFHCTEAYARHPVSRVTWYGAKAFAAWRGKRLPTEAEWEKAARGGRDNITFPWGHDPPGSRCNWRDIPAYPAGSKILRLWEDMGLLPVDTFEPNGYGLYNMAGNVSEWCEDGYNKKFYQTSPYRNPLCKTFRYYRVHRGGGFRSVMLILRCGARSAALPAVGASMIGFRCAMDAGQKTAGD